MSSSGRFDYKKLLDDRNVKRWFDNLERGSSLTADVYLRRLGYTCRLCNVTPAALAKLKVKGARDFLMDLVSLMEKQNVQPSYMDNVVTAIKSWFAHNQTRVVDKIKMPDKKRPTKRDAEQSPLPDAVGRLLDVADIKQKTASTLVAFSGLRLESLGDFRGKDGLMLSDLPELEYDNDTRKVNFRNVPSIIQVRATLSKAGHQYLTFCPQQSCDYLKEVLEYRMSLGEKLVPTSPVLTSLKWHKSSLADNYVSYISTRKVSESIRVAIRKAGFDWRPYILRTYFDTRMMLAEADGLVIRDWRVFWMGHTGDIEHVYTLNKKLPEDLIERMRLAFAKASDAHLVTVGKKVSEMKNVAWEEMNKFYLDGSELFSEQEILELGDLSKIDPKDLRKMVRERMQEEEKAKIGLSNGGSQKVVPRSEVKSYLEKGWNFKTWFSEDEAIISLPDG